MEKKEARLQFVNNWGKDNCKEDESIKYDYFSNTFSFSIEIWERIHPQRRTT